jgi:type IV pilus assembly protein PilB
VGINNDTGLTFEKILKAFLRQDPDVMLVGEIRDFETAEIAMKASITGHLVLSTLHTNDAASTIPRLVHMGIPPYLVVAALRLILAQRLVRLLCPKCKIETVLSEQEKSSLTREERSQLLRVYRGLGCSSCGGLGYVGRSPIMEVLPVRTAEMRELILQSPSADRIRDLARREGMRTLRENALEFVASGQTSLQEALKIIMAE